MNTVEEIKHSILGGRISSLASINAFLSDSLTGKYVCEIDPEIQYMGRVESASIDSIGITTTHDNNYSGYITVSIMTDTNHFFSDLTDIQIFDEENTAKLFQEVQR